MVPRASLWDNFSPMLGPIWCKNVKKCDLQWETKANIYTKTSDSFLKICESFVLCFVIFRLIFCAEYSPRGNGSSGGYRKECWWLVRARWRGGLRPVDTSWAPPLTSTFTQNTRLAPKLMGWGWGCLFSTWGLRPIFEFESRARVRVRPSVRINTTGWWRSTKAK